MCHVFMKQYGIDTRFLFACGCECGVSVASFSAKKSSCYMLLYITFTHDGVIYFWCTTFLLMRECQQDGVWCL